MYEALRQLTVHLAFKYYMTAKVAFIVPRTVFIASTKCEFSYPEKMVRPEPAVAVEDEKFFFKVSRLVLPIVVIRPCGII